MDDNMSALQAYKSSDRLDLASRFRRAEPNPIPPPASLSRKQIPACSKAAWIRIRVKTSAPHAQDNWLGFTRPIINAAWVMWGLLILPNYGFPVRTRVGIHAHCS